MKEENPWVPVWCPEKSDWRVDLRVERRHVRRTHGIRDKDLRTFAVDRARDLYRSCWNETVQDAKREKLPTFAEAAELFVQQGGVDEIASVDIA